MKKIFFVILSLCFVLFMMALPFSKAQAFYQCVSEEVCGDGKGKIESDKSKCGDCDDGYVCCWKDWTNVVYSTDEVPKEFRIFGVDMTAEEVKNLIKLAMIIGISSISFGIIGVIVYGGFLWITAGEREEQLQNAKKTVKAGFVALAIMVVGFLSLGIIAGILGVDITNDQWIDEILEE